MKTTNKRILSAILASAITISLTACGSRAANTDASGSLPGAKTLAVPVSTEYASQTLQSTKYGTMDWSTASQGYITFTAKGQARTFILEGPNGIQVLSDADKDDSIKLTLIDGVGRYQYAISNRTDDGKRYRIMYKNSFTVNSFD